MSNLTQFIQNLIHGQSGYEIRTQGTYQCYFYSNQHDKCRAGIANPKLQNQFVYLQLLAEEGKAELVKDGFLVKPEIIAKFDSDIKLLFDINNPWDGAFELKSKGQTWATGEFEVSIALKTNTGNLIRDYELEGPFIQMPAGQKYTLDYPQYLALAAVKRHSSLSLSDRTEAENLTVIYEIQQAKKAGLNIKMRHFEEIDVETPNHIGIAVTLNNAGLRVSPEFGIDGISPDEIEKRLQQLNGNDSVCIRIRTANSSKIVKFTEKELKAIQEILANKEISAKDRDSFLKAPGAFLDSYLVDLDNGFSIRVHGSEIFKPAYFGDTDSRHIDWHDKNNQNGIVIPLCNLAKIDLPAEDQERIITKIEAAVENDEKIIIDDVATIVLPSEKNKTLELLNDIKNKLSTPSSSTEKIKNGKVVLAVDLNDDTLFNETQTSNDQDPSWRGELFIDDLLLKPFDYQIEGIRWFVGHAIMAQKNNDKMAGALLADDMGLGKTFMSLAGIYAWQNILKRSNSDSYFSKPILVVAPLVLLENWKDEINKYFSKSPFKDVVILQSDGDLGHYRSGVKNDSEYEFALKVGKNYFTDRLDLPKRLILTTYASLQRYQFSLSAIDWGCVIFDEAQNIKSPNALSSRAAKALKADFRLAVTGTPVENNLIDFWNIFDTVKPGFLNTCKDFRQKYVKPINEPNAKDEIRVEVGKALRNKVSHFMLRRSKEEKLSSLPNKKIFSGEVVDNVNLAPIMNGEQLNKYNQVILEVCLAKKAKSEDLRKLVLSSLLKMRDISLHPFLSDELRLPQNKQDSLNFLNQSQKLISLLQILYLIKSRNEKVIVFAINRKLQLYLSFSLKYIFNLSEVPIINGETAAVEKNDGRETRKAIIEKFEAQSGFGIIIVSPLAAGVGLTITGANNVIHLERHWNPAKEAQATDRVYRIGQKRDVNIYIPILDHPDRLSFDRNLDRLLQKKTDLKDAVISPVDLKVSDFDTDQIFGVSINFDSQ